jgi:NAD(P)-dependent dehydrogenase (short-subunit alcohol dehydrogenase family)
MLTPFSAYVTVVDVNEKLGQETVQELTKAGNQTAQFVTGDVTNWDDQVRAFEAAVNNSPHKSCDIVIANAGIVGQDDIFDLQGQLALTTEIGTFN